MAAKIKQIYSREILNSKGNPTIETTVILNDSSTGVSSCPSGTSVGSYEAVELKDTTTGSVQTAIDNIKNQIAPRLVGIEADKQQEIDKIMIDLDGTQNKARLGANAILSVSMSVAKAAAESSVLPLFLYLREFVKKENVPLKIPTPAFNLINGGVHGDNNMNFQEFLLIPASSKSYTQALGIGTSIYQSLRKTLETNNLTRLVGDEGGYGPTLATNLDVFSILKQAIEATPLRIGFDVFFGLDVAANNFFVEGKYHLKDRAIPFSSNELISYYEDLNKNFNLLYLEDPLSQDDWEGWANLSSKMGATVIVGDDLTATNPYRLQMALDKKSITGIVIKPNQIGTVIESLAVVEIARQSGLKIVVSHRSGETNDDFIADFAVATSADYVKFGAPARGERVAKYNRLSQIENQLKLL